ncbi:MAG: hypothetical protein IJS01_15610 [Lentisphaeria bacterium]|nr:hypothetical protein [Lentisphaeria bacterium]
MKILQDLHIHSHHSCDSACSTQQDIRKDREALGLRHYAVTDHLHTQYNISDIESSRHDFLGHNFPAGFHFGVEVTCMATWECERIAAGDFIPKGDVPIYGFRDDERPFDGRMCIGIDENDIRKYGIELVVGGVHWPQGFPSSRTDAIDNYFKQEMFLAAHPLVSVVAHPWDSLQHAAGDWFRHRDKAHIDWSVYKDIPREMDDRLGEEILKNGKLAEINLPCVLKGPDYVRPLCMERFRRWKEMGVKFTLGSDQHSAHPDVELFSIMEKVLDDYGFTQDDFALPFEVQA